MNNAYTRLYQNIAEYFEGFKELRILGNYNYFYDETKISTNEIAKSDIRQSLVTIAPRYILETIVILLAILLLLFNYESERGILNILPTLAIFGAAILRLVPIANQITRFYSQVRYGKDAIDRIYEQLTYLNHLNIINEEKNNQDLDDFNSLQIESLRYKYPSSSEENLFVEKFNLYNGEAVGIIGKSGSGKTTLIDLIMGLLNTHSGSIKVNNIKLSEIYEKWWHMVAYLPQDVFLINNSIALNIALGSEEKDINYKRLTEAIEKAKLTEFINSLPDGIETNIGQRGIKISGGQKQRIALARTFYYDRKIIILDEATNSLDSKIEDEIYNEIKSLKGDITLIIISHRTKSLDFCDRIYEVKNKTVKEI